MVKTNGKVRAKSSMNLKRAEDQTSLQPENLNFEIDSELLESRYNFVRRPILPYGIVVNEQVRVFWFPKIN